MHETLRSDPGDPFRDSRTSTIAISLPEFSANPANNMKKDLREVYLAPNQASAEVAIDVFAEKYAAKYDKAVECLTKDREALLALYDFPAEHWDHLRTTNPIESVFATGSAQDGAHERLIVPNDRQADGLQAALRRIKDLAPTQRYKSLAEGHRRRQIPRRHRGHPSAGKPRRLIAPSPTIPHSSRLARAGGLREWVNAGQVGLSPGHPATVSIYPSGEPAGYSGIGETHSLLHFCNSSTRAAGSGGLTCGF
jgi:hypothetical protein